jgi:hypothetical protein
MIHKTLNVKTNTQFYFILKKKNLKSFAKQTQIGCLRRRGDEHFWR